MSQAKRLLSGALVLASGQIVGQGSVFLRNLIVVHTLTKLDYGTSATFAIALGFLEVLTDFGFFRLLIQAKDGNDPDFQKTAQSLRVLQGAVIAIGIFLLAPWICDLFSVPDALWAFRLLALAPLFNASQHFDVHRFQREGRYGPVVLAETGAPLVSLVTVAALSPWVRDYSLVLWAILVQTAVNSLLSHVAAERPYRLSLQGSFVRRLFTFGWPLLLNGFVLAFIQQGDRTIVGAGETMARKIEEWLGPEWVPSHVFDKEDLAVYALGIALTLIPRQVSTRTLSRLLFPVLSRAQDDREKFRAQYSIGLQMFALYAAGVASFFVIGGTSTVVILYSERYRGVEPFLGVLAVMNALVVLRLAPTTASLALADSKAVLIGNLGRVVGVFAAGAVAIYGGGLREIALCGVLGEGLGLSVLSLRLQVRHALPITTMLGPFAFLASATAIAYGIRELAPIESDWAWIAVAAVDGAILLGAAALAFPQLFRRVREMIRRGAETRPSI